jgi:hypothetical protein
MTTAMIVRLILKQSLKCKGLAEAFPAKPLISFLYTLTTAFAIAGYCWALLY